MTVRLGLSGVSKNFGGLRAVSDVSFETMAGEVFGIIGPNGAGKTTLFNLMAGTIRPVAGTIRLDGADITDAPTSRIVSLGMARTFQAATAFRQQTVIENLRRGYVFSRMRTPLQFLSGAAPRAASRKVDEILDTLGLRRFANVAAGSLAYGLQKNLGVGMALMTGPSLILMDEPAAGLNPAETQQIGLLIKRLRDERGIDVVVVEHDVKMIMDVCDRILVLNQGQVLHIGTPASVSGNQQVIDAYLGVDLELA